MAEPIHVDMLPRRATETLGRLGLTIMPGKNDPTSPEVEEDLNRDLDEDLDRIRKFYEIRTLVSLVEDSEYAAMGLRSVEVMQKMRQHKIDFLRYPMRPNVVPSDLERFDSIVHTILSVLHRYNVAVHCRSGKNRAGMVAAGVLIAIGFSVSASVSYIRTVRLRALPSGAEVEFLKQYEEFLRGVVPLGDYEEPWYEREEE